MKAILYTVGLFVSLFVLWLWIVPCHLFDNVSYSTVVTDRNGKLIGARISKDEQWRFPKQDSLPDKYIKCLVKFEDKGFYHHLGISPSAILKSAYLNIKAGKIKRGASTITMQLARMSRKKKRTFVQKIIEAFIALQIEARYTKDEILLMYAAHAPYGGNVVGYPAACWRYLGHDGRRLSWGEASVMAILQNSPALINLEKKRPILLEKRNRLLNTLYLDGVIPEEDYQLALQEALPGRPQKIPSSAPHLVEWYAMKSNGKYIRTSIDMDIQQKVESIAKQRNEELRLRGANDLSIVVFDIPTGELLAYCGNANTTRARAGVCVDIARAKRSSGSLLKPLLYCAALQDGYILPDALIPDIPININGFRPHNYDMEFRGAVSASESVYKSLNVPSVLLLRDYGVAHFTEVLKRCGITSLTRNADDYGLSLILGGAEITLLEITRAYSKMARNYEYTIPRNNESYDNPAYSDGFEKSFFLTDKSAIYYTIETMRKVERLDHLDIYKVRDYENIAWKTGTSYGARDAWAVGFDNHYAVGVWTGNAEGHGVPEMSGVHTASPIMFDIFNLLTNKNSNKKKWFSPLKMSDGVTIRVCKESGMQAGLDCPNVVSKTMPKSAFNTPVCKYHHIVQLTIDGKYRESNPAQPTKDTVFFSLPANLEFYYKRYHPEYTSLPPFSNVTIDNNQRNSIAFIYPQNGSVISCVGKSSDKNKGVVFHLAHKHPNTEVFWFIDGRYLTSTFGEHKLLIDMEEGRHKVTAVDENGDKAEVRIENKR